MIKVHSSKRLYDGPDQESWQSEFQMALENNESISFSCSQAIELDRLATLIPEPDFSWIVKECGLHGSAPWGFKSSQGLQSYFRVVQLRYLIVFSFGESQPGRYQLNVEGVFQDWASPRPSEPPLPTAHFPPATPAQTLVPTASTLCAFIVTKPEKVYFERPLEKGIYGVEKWVRASVEEGTRIYHEIGSGPGDGGLYWIDVVLHLVRGSHVSSKWFSYPEDGVSAQATESVLSRVGSTPAVHSQAECSLLKCLRALNAGKPTSLLRILGVKDEALPDFYFVSDMEKVMELFADHKPMASQPGVQIGVFGEAPSDHYRSRSFFYYSPRSDLAPFIEAEFAKQGIIFKAAHGQGA